MNKVREYIGSPDDLGKAPRTTPHLNLPIKRRVLTGCGALEEKETILTSYLGSGLSGTVYQGKTGAKAVVEKFTADMCGPAGKSNMGKALMGAIFLFFRQAPLSYRTNFYAAMSNHYASLIIADASEFEFGESSIPRIEYTSYDHGSGGYVMAYEYIEGRHIRPGREEKLLRANLKKWKEFIAFKLGLWGIARQCDVNNINSPANVLIVDEDTMKMKLVDVTPGILGGQIYFLPLEFEYFFKGITTGNFLPFGDAVDIEQLKKYCAHISRKIDKERAECFAENCARFESYLNMWRDSEPAILRSPLRIIAYLFNMDTMKATARQFAANLEHAGVISAEKGAAARKRVEGALGRGGVSLVRLELCLSLFRHIARIIPGMLWRAMRSILVDIPLRIGRFVIRFIRFIVKIYVDPAYRRNVSRQKIKEWVDTAVNIDKRITREEAQALYKELENKDILEILQVGPLWSVAKVIKPPIVGTMANITLICLLVTTLNPYWLIPLFADGIVRFVITIIFTGFKYRRLLFLSLIPTFGFIIPVPAELMGTAPDLTRFLMREVLGSKIGAFPSGVDKNSFRAYFYIRLMDIPLYFMKLIAGPVRGIEEK